MCEKDICDPGHCTLVHCLYRVPHTEVGVLVSFRIPQAEDPQVRSNRCEDGVQQGEC